jgi:hypothetical protein
VICIYVLRFRAFLLHFFINIQRVDWKSCKMLIKRRYNLLPNYEQDLALLTTTQEPVIGPNMTHKINQMAFDLMLHETS